MRRSRRLFKKLAKAIASERHAGTLDVEKLATRYRALQDALETALLPAGHPIGIEGRKGAQSKQFMMQILPHIQNYMRGFPRGTGFNLLDVGPGAGYGSSLLGSLYASRELGYRVRVTTVDITPTYHDYIRVLARFVAAHKVADIFAMEETYDIVMASHVIEHVRGPLAFCRRLQELSTGAVFVCAPYMERREKLTRGHINIFDDAFLESLNPDKVELVESPAWGLFLEPRYRMFIARLPGLASSTQPAPIGG